MAKPVGRPKKAKEVVEAKPENPDCEPATKGYVKCIVRKAAEHKHEQRSSGTAASVMLASLAVGWVFAAGLHESTLAWICGIGALMMFALLIELRAISDFKTCTSTIDGGCNSPYCYPKYLQKYTPPPCNSEKKDCE